MFKTFSILIFLVTLIMTPSAFALDGAVSGGGGRSVVCRDKQSGRITRAELLDIFEADVIFHLNLVPSQPDLDKQIQWLENKFKGSKHQYTFTRESYQKEFMDKVQFMADDMVLNPVDDSFEPVVKKECAIEQVANYHQSGRILVKQEIWNAFTPRSKVALAMHELAYKEARDLGRPSSSYYVRRFVGLMFSTTPVSNITEMPKYDVNYICTNSDMQLGVNEIYRVLIGGNRCRQSPSSFCEGQVKFLSLNGQPAYDDTAFDFGPGQEFLRALTQSQGPSVFSAQGPIQSKVFEGVSLFYTVIIKNGVPTPLLKTNQPDSKGFVELTCQKL